MRTNHHKFKDAIRAYLRQLAAERDSTIAAAIGMSLVGGRTRFDRMQTERGFKDALAQYVAALDTGTAGVVAVGDFSTLGAARNTAAAISQLQGALSALAQAQAAAEQQQNDIGIVDALGSNPAAAQLMSAQAALAESLAGMAEASAGTAGGVESGEFGTSQAAVEFATTQLQSGLGALFVPAGAGSFSAPYIRTGSDENNDSSTDKLLILIDIAAMVARCCLYIYQRKNLLAEKAGKTKPFLENGSISLNQFVDGNNYTISIAVSTIWENVYRYTAQKTRFIAAAEVQAEKSIPAGAGVERGIDLWAFSTNEKDKGLFEQFMREATGLLGIEYDVTTMVLSIKKYSIITAGMLAALRDDISTALTQYVLYRWYELAGHADEVKLRQAAFGTAFAAAQGITSLFNEQEKQTAMLTDFLHEAASQLWRRMSGYAPSGISFLFNNAQSDYDADTSNDYSTLSDEDINNSIEDYLEAIEELTNNVLGGKAAFLLNATARAVKTKALRIAENVGESMYHYALSAWYGMQEDRNEYAKHRADSETAKGNMMVIICN